MINPNFCDTITIYNRIDGKDIGERYDSWHREVVTDCSFVHSCAGNTADFRQHTAHDFVVRIPKSSNYLQYTELVASSYGFTIRIGDVVMLGIGPLEYTDDVLRGFDAFRVKGFADNSRRAVLGHYKVTG